MFKATELLGQMLQSGMSSSTAARLRHAMGPHGLQPDGSPGELLGRTTDEPGPALGGTLGGLAETAPDFSGADRSGQGAGPPAVSGPGGPAGAVLGGGSSGVEGAAGGGAMALLSGLAFSALGKSEAAPGDGQVAEAPRKGAAGAEELEHSATLILAAMINAAKADGQVDQEELQRIVGKLRAAGADAEALDFVISELNKPSDLEGLIRRVPSEHVAVQLYAASLLAIEVDTEAERRYLRRLAHGLGLDSGVVRRVHQCFGMGHA